MPDGTVILATQDIVERYRIRSTAFGWDFVSLWTRLTLLYRLLMRAQKARLHVEATPAMRQRDRARQAFWRDGGDLGS